MDLPSAPNQNGHVSWPKCRILNDKQQGKQLMYYYLFYSLQSPDPQNLDLSDDEELTSAMDYHSMIIRTHHNDDLDHIVTADEVISELEIMMEVRLPLMLCNTITHLTHKHS